MDIATVTALSPDYLAFLEDPPLLQILELGKVSLLVLFLHLAYFFEGIGNLTEAFHFGNHGKVGVLVACLRLTGKGSQELLLGLAPP